MYRRILIPVDGSPCSSAALEHALQLAADQKATVSVIHVLDIQLLYAYVEGVYVETVERAWREAGQALITEAIERGRQAGLQVEGAVIDAVGGRVPDAIVAESQEARADLIVMGTHGRHGIDHLLLGSVAEGVVRTTSVPVLLIHRP